MWTTALEGVQPTSMSAGNELKFRAYIFIPKSVDENKKYPLIVFPHSGVHADMDTYYAHIIRELIAQEYIVVAADYRGRYRIWFGYSTIILIMWIGE